MPTFRLHLLGGVELLAQQGDAARPIPLPPKPLALLAYLAVAGTDGRPIRRDTLLALFWPELPEARARAALRQVLFRLRRVLGTAALRADRETIAVVEDVLSCDVVAFDRAVAAGDDASAVALYCGELLDGFYVDGMTPELEAWMERQRARLREEASRGCWALVAKAEGAGDPGTAVQWARRAAALAATDEIAVRRLVELLGRVGDRAGALAVADGFTRRMAEDFGVQPSAQTQAVVAAVRERGFEATDSTTVSEPGPPTRTGRREDRAAGTTLSADAAATPPGMPPGGSDTTSPGGNRPRRRRWARRLSVTALVLLAILASGGPVTSSRASAVAHVGSRGAEDGSPPATVASPVARRLYEEGLARYDAGDSREAERLLRAALAEDAACAMCAYYAGVADGDFNVAAGARMLRLAVRLSRRVSLPERMLIRYAWLNVLNSPARLVLAESLAVQYPRWPEANLALAYALMAAGRPPDAVPYLRRIASEKRLPHDASVHHCAACEAESMLIDAYEAADSMPAALRTARLWVRAQPRSSVAWYDLGRTLARAGDYVGARAALDTSTSYAGGSTDDPLGHAIIEIRAGRFAVADRLLSVLAQTGNANERHDALWWRVISLRTQGRLREALALAVGPLRESEAASTIGVGVAPIAEAQVQFEMGHFERAAALFRAHSYPADSMQRRRPGVIARQRAWMLTQAGSALAAAGDTTALAPLADTVESWGSRSGFGRDRHLHEYLLGLLWLARRRPELAAQWFWRAISSEADAFSRVNLQLARALLAVGRPDGAIPVLRDALSGPMEAGGFYVTRTEVEDLLARAYDAAGQADSAAVYDRRVVRAWRSADPRVQPQAARARARLALDQRRLVARRSVLPSARPPTPGSAR